MPPLYALTLGLTAGIEPTVKPTHSPPPQAALRPELQTIAHDACNIRTERRVLVNQTLRHPGAPTKTCYGVIQGAKLLGQRSKRWKPHLAKD
jgi:hypothetical protein